MPPAQPARVLGLFDTTCIVIGAIIGVGIFFTPASVVRATGSGDLATWAWVIGGVCALCGTLSFAELGSRYTGNGAQYQALRDAYHPLPAFLYVFCNATATQAGVLGIIAVICAQNLGIAIARPIPQDARLLAVASGLIIVLAIANILGIRYGSRIQNLTVILKLAALAWIITLGLTSPATAAPLPAPETPKSTLVVLLMAIVATFFSYGGAQHCLWLTGEVKNPQRNLPIAIATGISVVIAVYLLANWAYLRLLGESGVAASQSLAADAVGGAVGKRVIAGAVAISAFGILNAQLLAGPRLVYGMAADGRFFSVFGRLSRFGTPAAAITMMAVVALGLLWAAGPKGVDMLLNGVMLVDGLFVGMTAVGVIVLRGSAPAGGFRTPLWPVTPAIFALGCFGVVAGTFLDEKMRVAALIAAGWIVVAAGIYFVFFRTGTGPGRARQSSGGLPRT